ncbi:hypothetical protein H5410_003248, partial [Solanum commersonii]
TPSDHGGSETILFCGLGPLGNRPSKSGSIGSIKLPYNLLVVCPRCLGHPVALIHPINLPLPSTHHLFGSPSTGVGSSFRGPGTESKLVALSDEAACSLSPEPM